MKMTQARWPNCGYNSIASEPSLERSFEALTPQLRQVGCRGKR